MLNDEQLAGIEKRASWSEAARQRGSELMRIVPTAQVYVGICGAAIDFDEFRLSNGIGLIRKVTNAPGIVHVCGAADLSKTDYLGVSRYSSAIRAEIALGLGVKKDERELLIDVAWITAALLKLRGHTNLTCPCFATESWDVITGIKENRVLFGMLDDAPAQIRCKDRGSPVSLDDMKWVDSGWNVALELRAVDRSRRFGLATNISYTWNHTNEPRIALANLWCGIEALFADKTDRPVTRRVVERVCSWLPALVANDVEDSYNRRCDAVHGRCVGDEITEAVCFADNILRAALVRCIDSNSVPLPDWTP